MGNSDTYSLASPCVLPVAVALLLPPLVLAAADASKDCWKSPMMSSMCSVPTEIRIRSCVSLVFCSCERGFKKVYLSNTRRKLLLL